MSTFYKKVLVPVDGSHHAETACRHAAGLTAGGGEVILMHCYGDLPNLIGGDAREEVIAASEAEARVHFEPCIKICEAAGVPFKTIVNRGHPSRCIVIVAKREQCDLIAMGSRGLSDFSGMVMGSVSHRVLEYVDIPVLIVK